MWKRWCGPREMPEGLMHWFQLCCATYWSRVAGPLWSLQIPVSSWSCKNSPKSPLQGYRATHSLVPKSSSNILYEGGEYLSVNINWGLLICCQRIDISLLLVLITCLFWPWLPFLTINRLLQGLGVSLNARKLLKFPSVLRYRRLFSPLYFLIHFCLNKSLVKVGPFLPKHKFG